jgi:two-component system, NtrC family, response regulator HydG
MKPTLLLIDDDPVDIRALAFLIESWDYQVVMALSGKAGLEALAAGPVDAVIADVRMPGMSGIEVVEELGQRAPGLPIILITGYGDVRAAVKAMKIGAFDYVVKPPDPDEFRLIVARALEHSRLRRENDYLRAELAAGGLYGDRIVGRSPKMLELFDLIHRVARTDSTVLICGETGTGKELVAQAIHYKSHRAQRPLVAMNCASLNQNLIESELFGHEKGAFTGAVAARRGRFEEADGGTLLLDEISETSLEFQAKLLRAVQEQEFRRVGGNQSIAVNVRVLASTNRDLRARVEEEKFREDLFYRLSVIVIQVPPLRERPEDVELLARHFLTRFAERYHCPAKAFSKAALEDLRARRWEGNVRELQHAVERAVVLSDREILEPDDVRETGSGGRTPETKDLTLKEFLDKGSRDYLVQVLDSTGWRKGKAASILGIDRATLYRMLRKYSLER